MLISPLKKGETVYTVLRSVSRSGLSRVIDVFVIRKNEPIPIMWTMTDEQKKQLPKMTKKGEFGYIVKGCGMDMGYHLVDTISYIMFGKGYELNHKWL